MNFILQCYLTFPVLPQDVEPENSDPIELSYRGIGNARIYKRNE